MWANENWTRRWDGSEQEVLLSQDYRDEDEAALIETFARYFDDPRYIRLEGRPLLMVYRAGLIPGGAETVARWRRGFAAAGHQPMFVMAQSFGERDPRDVGMDAAVEFPPHKLTEHLPQLNRHLRMLDFAADARIFDYDVVAGASDLSRQPFPLIRTALPGWDNDARRQGRGMTIHGGTPASYQAWLSRADRGGGAAKGGRRGDRLHQCMERMGRGRLPRAGRAFRGGIPERDRARGECVDG